MPMTCPHCLQHDLTDGAKRCHHCGSPTDSDADQDRIEQLRKTFREEVRDDLREHRAMIDTILKRLQTVAVFIVGAALAAVAFLLFDTKQNVSETRRQIVEGSQLEIQKAAELMRQTAEEKIQQTTDRVTREAETTINEEVAAFLQSEEFSETMNEAFRTAMDASIQEAIAERAVEVDAKVEGALAGLNSTLAKITGLEEQIKATETEFTKVQTAFDITRKQQVSDSRSVLPVEFVRDEGKADPGRIPEYLERKVQALSFWLGGGYDGPMVWKYMDRLSTMPEFKYVVVFDGGGGGIFGLYNAKELKTRFDPPNQTEMSEARSADVHDLPSPGDVPGWTVFARLVSERATKELQRLPSFQSGAAPVGTDWSSVDALRHMDRLGADLLPVVDSGGDFVGVVDRSRLTTGLLIELAAKPD